MQAKKLECLVTEAEPPMFEQMLGTAEADFYGHQSKHGSFVFGGSTGLEAYNKDNGRMISSSIGSSCICRCIMRYFPLLSDTKIVRAWTGFADESADKIPVISQVEEVPGLYVACGFTGHGFGIGPGAAYNLAEIINGETPAVDMSPFRYDRFKAKI